MKFVSALMFFSFLFLSACAPKVHKEIGQLKLKYEFPEEQAVQSNLVISLISPSFQSKTDDTSKQLLASNPFLQAMMAQGGMFNLPDFNMKLKEFYLQRVKTGFDNAFVDMITRKGFVWKGPFGSFDDMTYDDKKKSYLSLLPEMSIFIEKKGTSLADSKITKVVTERGSIVVSGEMLLSLVEPMTKERIMSKRINLSEFNICKEYIYQTKIGSNGLIFDAMTSGTELQDNTDKVLAEAINEFYTKSMDKIYKMISEEEILSYQVSVQELKELKRF